MVKEKKRFALMTVFCSFVFAYLVSAVSAATIVTTDSLGNPQTDFSPDEIVYIKGTGFNSNSFVLIDITRPDGVIENIVAITNNLGKFTANYNLDGIVGNYYVYATDGVHSAQAIFTDAAIWTTKNDCGASNQDVNHYTPGEMVFINGDGFSAGNYSWEIKGKPGGASCDPNVVVVSGTKNVNATGEFCFNAYTVMTNDCGEYGVKFSNKGDNYRVEGNACSTNAQCGKNSSELICVGNNVANFTESPKCLNGNCTITNSTQIIQNCGNASSQLICVGTLLVNVTKTPQCSDGECSNSTKVNIVQNCTLGCSNAMCNQPICGNGAVEGNEQCDDGNQNNMDACKNNCRLNICGDGVVKTGVEQCDDGNQNNTDGCRNNCMVPVCGDGIKDPNEQCDDGNQNNTDMCRNNCMLPTCGDGIVNGNEQCDDGNTNNNDACRNSCLLPVCGDGIKDANEQCDDGNQNNMDACTNQCTNAVCGDGIVRVGVEECDDGNNNNADSCRNNCELPICGDGILDQGEQCDDGNNNFEDGCNAFCFLEFCGDGIVQQDIGEECEPPSLGNCDSQCKFCEDKDNDDVCDEIDMCPYSRPQEPVDENGCDIFQFCDKFSFSCGVECQHADWRGNEPDKEFPNDCKLFFMVVEGEMTESLRCVPTVFSEMCAG